MATSAPALASASRSSSTRCALVPARAAAGRRVRARAHHHRPHPRAAQCKKEAKGLELVSISEFDVCKYKMILSLPQWCNVKQ